jgi:hypothetical protein
MIGDDLTNDTYKHSINSGRFWSQQGLNILGGLLDKMEKNITFTIKTIHLIICPKIIENV